MGGGGSEGDGAAGGGPKTTNGDGYESESSSCYLWSTTKDSPLHAPLVLPAYQPLP